MKNLFAILILMVSTSAMAERINLSNNTQARKLVMKQRFVKDQFKKIDELSNGQAELVLTTSTEMGIRDDLGLDEKYYSGMKHKFIFENEDGSLSCRFSIYVIYQLTQPLSLATRYSEVTYEANCNRF